MVSVDELASNLLALLDERQAPFKTIKKNGPELINDFLNRPGVKKALLSLNVEKKVRLWGIKGSGLQILFHGTDTPKKSAPHDHGKSWALYHQVTGITEMSTYRRSLGSAGLPGDAVLELTEQTDLTPGNAMFFGPLVIHSTNHRSPPARWIRVTGTDLDFAERLRFSIERQEAVLENKN